MDLDTRSLRRRLSMMLRAHRMVQEHIDLPGVAQESPLFETSLIAPVDTLVEKIEPTHIKPSVEEEPPMDEMPTIVEVSRVVIEFTGNRCPQ